MPNQDETEKKDGYGSCFGAILIFYLLLFGCLIWFFGSFGVMAVILMIAIGIIIVFLAI